MAIDFKDAATRWRQTDTGPSWAVLGYTAAAVGLLVLLAARKKKPEGTVT